MLMGQRLFPYRGRRLAHPFVLRLLKNYSATNCVGRGTRRKPSMRLAQYSLKGE